MQTRSLQPSIRELAKRLDRLEHLVAGKQSMKGGGSMSHRLQDLLETQRLQDSKRVREVLKLTFGMISKERGRAWLKTIARGRASWK